MLGAVDNVYVPLRIAVGVFKGDLGRFIVHCPQQPHPDWLDDEQRVMCIKEEPLASGIGYLGRAAGDCGRARRRAAAGRFVSVNC